MDQNQGTLMKQSAFDTLLARKLQLQFVADSVGDRASEIVPSLLAEQGWNRAADIHSRPGRAVDLRADDNSFNRVTDDAVLEIRTAISDAAREVWMNQNPGTLLQQSTYDALLARQLQLEFIADSVGNRASNPYPLSLPDQGGRNRDVDNQPFVRRAVDPPLDDNARIAMEAEDVASVSAGTTLDADGGCVTGIHVPHATLVVEEEVYLATIVTPPEPKLPLWKRGRSKFCCRKATSREEPR
jgi:hypothetical protein